MARASRNALTDTRIVEEVEKATARMVCQAVWDFCAEAEIIFTREKDYAGDIGEDLTREALDSLGMSRIPLRLFGKIDYKRARYVFHPNYSLKQALFVDSKAEKLEGEATATIQTSQTSMRIRQKRAGQIMDVQGELPTILQSDGVQFLTTTIFVKYNYRTINEDSGDNELVSITVATLPNGILQNTYNPTWDDTIWMAGRNAPTLGEEFRVRLKFARLKANILPQSNLEERSVRVSIT